MTDGAGRQAAALAKRHIDNLNDLFKVGFKRFFGLDKPDPEGALAREEAIGAELKALHEELKARGNDRLTVLLRRYTAQLIDASDELAALARRIADKGQPKLPRADLKNRLKELQVKELTYLMTGKELNELQ